MIPIEGRNPYSARAASAAAASSGVVVAVASNLTVGAATAQFGIEEVTINDGITLEIADTGFFHII